MILNADKMSQVNKEFGATFVWHCNREELRAFSYAMCVQHCPKSKKEGEK